MSDTATDILLRIRVDVTNVQAVAKLNAALTEQQKRLSNLDKMNTRFGKSHGLVLRAYEKLSTKLRDTERAMDAVFRAGVHLQAMGRDLVGFGQKVVGIVGDMVTAWGKYEYTLNRAAGAAGIFDTSLPIYDKLNRAVQDLARELRLFPAEDVAKGLYFWQSTTGSVIKTEEDLANTLTYVRDIMKLSAMTNTNYETSIKGVYSILKQFNKPMSETGKVVELLFFATQKTALEFPNLVESFKMFGAVAGGAKEPLETMVAVLGALGDAGFRGSLVGRALRQTYIKLVKPTAKAKEKLDELFKAQGGYNKVAFDAKGNFVGMEKYIWKLAAATKNMTYQQKANLLATITTANELPVMTKMLQIAHEALAAGADSWVDYRVNQEDATQAFAQSWEILAGSWQGVMGMLKQTVEPIFLRIGQMIAKKLTPILTELANALYELTPTFEDAAKGIMDTLAPALDWLMAQFRKIVDWAKKNPGIIKKMMQWGAIALIFSTLAGAVMLALGTLLLFINTSVLIVSGMLPIIAVIGVAIAAFMLLGTKIYDNVGGIRTAIERLFTSILTFFGKMFGGVEGFKTTVSDLVSAVSTFADGALATLAGWLEDIAAAIDSIPPETVQVIKNIGIALLAWVGLNKGLSLFKSLISGVASALFRLSGIGKIISLFQGLAKVVPIIMSFAAAIGRVALAFGAALLAGNPIAWVIAGIVAAIAAFVLAYQTNFGGFKDFIDGLVTWFVENVGPVINGVFQWLATNIPIFLQAVVDFINNVVTPAFNAFVTWLGETFGPLFDQIGKTIGSFIELLGTIPGAIGFVVGEVAKWLESLGINWNEVWAGIQTALSNAFTSIKTMFEVALLALWTIWNGVWTTISTLVKTVIEGIVLIIQGFWTTLQGIFDIAAAILKGDWEGLWNGIKTFLSGLLTTIQGLFKTGLAVVYSIISGALKAVDTLFKTIFGTGEGSIYSKVSGFINTLYKFGEDVVKGFLKGVGDTINWGIDQAKGFFGNIINGIKGFLGISSPATIMLSIGKNIVYGLWEGIKGVKDWIITKLQGFVKSVIPGPIKDVLGIKSPSKVMMAIGENVVKGLAKGITDSEDAKKAIVAQAEAVAAAVKAVDGTTANIGGSLNASTTAESTKTVNVNVVVTSPDNAVSRIDMRQLSNLITGSDMVRALEHMALVD